MALFKNPFGGNLITNLAIGVGAVILLPLIVPVVARIVRPAAKGAVKGGILISELVAGRHATTGDGAGPKPDAGKGEQSEVAPKASKTNQGIARPLAKRMVKGGLVVYEKGKQILSGTEAGVREPVVEAKAEIRQTRENAPVGNPTGVTGESALAAESAKVPAARKAARKTPVSPRTPASGRSRVVKKSATKPKKGD